MISKFLIKLLLSSALILCSCSHNISENKIPCISENQKDLIINCGTKYERTGGRIYYSINTNGKVYRIEENSAGSKMTTDTMYISATDYCYVKSRLEEIILKTHAMYYPGRIQEFFEYLNEKNNISYRAVWNQYTDFVEKKEIKALYDTLQYFINKPTGNQR